jgi:hypothetical protein
MGSLAVYPKPKPGAPPLPTQQPAYSAPMPLSAPAPQFPLPPQPVPSTPLSAPNLPPSPSAPPFTFTPPPAPGAAPTPTPFGAFSAPDPAQAANDPYYKFRLSQSLKGMERGAASRGTLLSGGLQGRLIQHAGDLASAEGDKIYGRAFDTYGANRATNAQNYGQALSSYTAGSGAALGAGGLGLNAATAAYDRAYGAGRDTYGDAAGEAARQNDMTTANNQAQDAYRRQMSEYAAQVEAQRAAANAAQNAATAPLPARRPLSSPFGHR